MARAMLVMISAGRRGHHSSSHSGLPDPSLSPTLETHRPIRVHGDLEVHIGTFLNGAAKIQGDKTKMTETKLSTGSRTRSVLTSVDQEKRNFYRRCLFNLYVYVSSKAKRSGLCWRTVMRSSTVPYPMLVTPRPTSRADYRALRDSTKKGL